MIAFALAREMYNSVVVTRQQTFGPVALGNKKWLRTNFPPDDDLFLPVSIYLDSSEGSAEMTKNVAEVLRAYGFNNIPRVYQAPGTFYIHFEAGFGSKDRKAARESKEELKADLLSKKPPKDLKKRRAVKKLNESVLRRAEKKLGTAIVAGVIFLGSIMGGVVTDLMKDDLKAWVVKQAPKADTFVAKELPPALATKFHTVVTKVIEESPHKSEVPPPPEE